MEVIIQKDAESAYLLVARMVANSLRENPFLVLGLATGATMERVYAELVRMHQEEDLDFSRCRTFNLDEYEGLAPDHPGSYRCFMDTHLFNNINIDKKNTHVPSGIAEDFDKECEEYEKKIAAAGGIDLQLLGIGASGHIGFNEPLSALRSRTRDKALAPATLKQNQRYFASIEDMPKRGLTMGVGTILDSRKCTLLATGKSKASIIAKAVEGPITSMVSATALQLHPHCHIVVDEDAASELQGCDYYRWIFDHEPHWDQYRQ